MKSSKKTRRIIIAVAVLLVFVLFIVVLINRVITLHDQSETISSLQSDYDRISEDNSRIEETISAGEDESYMEDMARQDGYVKPEERVYIDSDSQ